MKWLRMCSVVLVALSLSAVAEAGMMQCGAGKSCGCGPSDQPACCQPKIMYKPVVVRPTCPSVHSYQRQCVKPASYDNCCNKGGCCPKSKRGCSNGCGNSNCNGNCGNGNCGAGNCGPAGANCAAPAACGPAAAANCAAPAACGPAAAANCAAPAACGPAAAANCAAPARNCGPAACGPAAAANCAAPAANCGPAAAANCAAPAANCGPAAAANCAAPARNCGPAAANCGPAAANCAAPAGNCGPAGCSARPSTSCGATAGCNSSACCGIAQWIYQSQTACYAKDRRAAIRRLGKCDCSCNPEIMCAFVYALNDCDERVRAEAAWQIGHQVKCHPCCCSEKVSHALMCALGDCDKKVRKYAEKALCLCGYEVTSACNLPCSATSTCGANGCGPVAAHCGPAAATNCGPAVMAPAATPATVAPTAPAPAGDVAPAPAPPAAEPEAYFPARIRDQQSGASRTRTLGNLFGLR